MLTYLWELATSKEIESLTASLSSFVTAAAIAVGGIWAYFKYFRGRTFRPRLAVDLSGEWRRVDGADLLHVRVRVTNIGASKVALNQYGSGLEVGFPAESQEHDEMIWEKVVYAAAASGKNPPRTFEVLKEHRWIEPGETVSDDLLLNLGRPPEICVLEIKLLWALSNRNHGQFSEADVEVFARRILPSDAKIADTV